MSLSLETCIRFVKTAKSIAWKGRNQTAEGKTRELDYSEVDIANDTSSRSPSPPADDRTQRSLNLRTATCAKLSHLQFSKQDESTLSHLPRQ